MLPHSFRLSILLVALLAVSVRGADIPEYEIGDIATADILAPIRLLVPNPEATDSLKEKLDRQIPFIIRHSPTVTEEVEIAARNHITTTRRQFIEQLRAALADELPSEAHLGSPAYLRALSHAAADADPHFPFDYFAPLWTRGEDDEPLREQLVTLLRQTLSAIIIADDAALPEDRPLHLAIVRSLDLPPGSRDLGTALNSPAVPVVRIGDARRHLEAHAFAPPALGRFAAALLRPNALPDALAYERLRARQLDGIIVHDTYEPAQLVVRKGQPIDPAAHRALTAIREKTALTRLQSLPPPVAPPAPPASPSLARGIGIGLALIILLLAGILWRLRHAPAHTAAAPSPESLAWKQRAITAEAGAERARHALRSGALAWLKTKVARTLFRQRNELLAAQQQAETEVRNLEKRVENLQTPLQKRIDAYARRRSETDGSRPAADDSHRPLGTRRRADPPRFDAN